jgi:hypothetical protein
VAGLKLDSTGIVKMKTLDEAMLLLQRINGLVEHYAMAVKRNQPTAAFIQNIRRQLPSLAENLKGQFGLIADQVIGVNLSASRGSSEAMRVRALREGVAQIKQALEIALTQTKDKHGKHDEKDDTPGEDESEQSG